MVAERLLELFDEQMRASRAGAGRLYVVGKGWSAVLWPPADGDVEPLVARMREHRRARRVEVLLPRPARELPRAAARRRARAGGRGDRASSPRPPRSRRRPRTSSCARTPEAFEELAERVFGRSHGGGLPEHAVAVVAVRRRQPGLGRTRRSRAGRRLRRDVRRRDAARVPRPRALSRDRRAARRARARGRLPPTSTSTRCRRAGRSSSGSASSRSRRRRRSSFLPQLAERGPARVDRLLDVLVRLDVEILAADGTEPGAVGVVEDLLGQREHDFVARPRREVELVVVDVLRPLLLALGLRRLVFAEAERQRQLGVLEAAEARAVERDVERELEDGAARRARDDELGGDRIGPRLVLLAGEVKRLERRSRRAPAPGRRREAGACEGRRWSRGHRSAAARAATCERSTIDCAID